MQQPAEGGSGTCDNGGESCIWRTWGGAKAEPKKERQKSPSSSAFSTIEDEEPWNETQERLQRCPSRQRQDFPDLRISEENKRWWDWEGGGAVGWAQIVKKHFKLLARMLGVGRGVAAWAQIVKKHFIEPPAQGSNLSRPRVYSCVWPPMLAAAPSEDSSQGRVRSIHASRIPRRSRLAVTR